MEPRRIARKSHPIASVAFLITGLLLATACATPIGVRAVDGKAAQRQLTANVLSTGKPSASSMQVLQRAGWAERFWKEPEAALGAIHASLGETDDDDRLMALAELSFWTADHRQDRAWYLASAVYAYALLFPGEGEHSSIAPSDPRLRLAYDLYNRGLAEAFGEAKTQDVTFTAGRHALPFGAVDVTLAPPPSWGGYRLDRFVDAVEFEVRGLANRYRKPGIGAPLAASLAPPEAGDAPVVHHRVAPKLKIPVTAFLRLDQPRRRLRGGALQGSLELYDRDDATRVVVQGREVPLEFETTTPLAYTLEGSPIWDTEVAGFFSGSFQPLTHALQGPGIRPTVPTDGLALLHPYRPGRFPLVLVHGTASSPGRWAELANELENDPRISERFQIWFFIYNTGNPILYSASLLRAALTSAVQELDPDGHDPALREMVVMGHSQGGLLTKLTAVASGDAFWNNVSQVPLSELDLDDETRALLQQSLFFEPLPFVTRVIFLATPHGGSYLASSSPASWVSRLIAFPLTLTQTALSLATLSQSGLITSRFERLPTSVDNMTPGNQFLKSLGGLPVSPNVHAHSIIPVEGDGPLEQEGDGVVKYTSAHVEGVESETVIRGSGHSTQANPQTIEEIRRILLEHAAAN